MALVFRYGVNNVLAELEACSIKVNKAMGKELGNKVFAREFYLFVVLADWHFSSFFDVDDHKLDRRMDCSKKLLCIFQQHFCGIMLIDSYLSLGNTG